MMQSKAKKLYQIDQTSKEINKKILFEKYIKMARKVRKAILKIKTLKHKNGFTSACTLTHKIKYPRII